MRINPIKSNINFRKIYEGKTPDPKETVTILGSSKSTNRTLMNDYNCAQVTKALVLAGKNVLTGCGTNGIMGAAFKNAKENSKNEDGKQIQNLVIIKRPLWGDEDLENCVIIGEAKSEHERIADFQKCSDTFIIYPGGAGTLQEAASLIFENQYTDKPKKIILVGREYFKGLDKQYQTMYNARLCTNPEALYKIVDTVDEVLSRTL